MKSIVVAHVLLDKQSASRWAEVLCWKRCEIET